MLTAAGNEREIMAAKTPYEMLGGESGVRRLVHEFYAIMDENPEAAGIRAMHGKSLAAIEQKLFEYLSGWLGGPMLYQQKYGTVCLSAPHAPYPIGAGERDQWLRCMDLALERVGASQELKQMLEEPLFRVADIIVNRRDA